jgi:vacuolar-type H+-ATPase subunit I/STV1
MSTWLNIRAYAKLIGKDFDDVLEMIDSGAVESKEDEEGEIFIKADPQEALPARTQPAQGEVLRVDMETGDGLQFVEKTIGTILSMHEKVVDAKEETLEALKSENAFLKEALTSMQELYDEDRRTIEALTKELEAVREELEFVKRKYKLMWGKMVEQHAEKKR